MKVFEIITEAETTVLPAPATTPGAPTSTKPMLVKDSGKWAWKLPSGEKYGGFVDQKAAMDWAKNPENQKLLNKGAVPTAPAKPVEAPKAEIKNASELEKRIADLEKQLGAKAAEEAKAARIGKIGYASLWLGRAIGIYAIYSKYSDDVAVLQAGAEKGIISAEAYRTGVRIARELAFTNVAFTAGITKFVNWIIMGFLAVRIPTAIAGVVAAPATLGASVALIIISQAAILYLQNRLLQPDVQKKIGNWLFDYIDGVVKVTGLWEIITPTVEEAATVAKQDPKAVPGKPVDNEAIIKKLGLDEN